MANLVSVSTRTTCTQSSFHCRSWHPLKFSWPLAGWCQSGHETSLIVRSPFRAKHHVVVQYMARWMKCPLPPPPNPPSPTPSPCPNPTSPQPDPPSWTPPGQHDWWKTRRTRKNWQHYRQGTSHCSCLEQCFLFHIFANTNLQNKSLFKFFKRGVLPRNQLPFLLFSEEHDPVYHGGWSRRNLVVQALVRWTAIVRNQRTHALVLRARRRMLTSSKFKRC